MSRRRTVVKVGGSLFDIPRLGERLREWLAGLDADQILLVPGGGPTADAVRALDRSQELGDEKAHWLALEALRLNAHFLANLLPGAAVVADLAQGCGRLWVVDCVAFAAADEGRPGCLPHSWDVTSDSIAARVAVVGGATELVVLKSVDIPDGTRWEEAGRVGWVDPYFGRAVASGLAVRAVNFRRWCERET